MLSNMNDIPETISLTFLFIYVYFLSPTSELQMRRGK